MPHNLHILSNATGDCAASAGVSADCLPVWLYLPLCLCVCVNDKCAAVDACTH